MVMVVVFICFIISNGKVSARCVRPCIHRLFPCDMFPCGVVTRSDDGGRNCTTSQQHYNPAAN